MAEFEDIFETPSVETSPNTDFESALAGVTIEVRHASLLDSTDTSSLDSKTNSFQFEELDTLIADRAKKIGLVKQEIIQVAKKKAIR